MSLKDDLSTRIHPSAKFWEFASCMGVDETRMVRSHTSIAKLAEKRAQLGEVTAALAEAKVERDAAFADARSDYLKALEMTCQIRIWSLNN